MKVEWHSVKLDGFPEQQGEYLVTIEGVIEGLEPGVGPEAGERAVAVAVYYGSRAWGLREGVYRVVAWAELPELYKKEI